jgi:hypothetical protein
LLWLFAALLLPVPGSYFAEYFYQVPYHVLTVACMAAAIAIAGEILHAEDMRWGLALALAAVVVDASASDPLFIYIGVLPALAALIVSAGVRNERRALVFLVFLGSAVAGHLASDWNFSAPGFGLAGGAQMQHFSKFFRNGKIILAALFTSFGGDPFGLGPLGAGMALLRLPMVVLVLLPFFAVVWRMACRALPRAKTRPAVDFVDAALSLTVLADIAAMLSSSYIMDMSSVRFFLPGWAGLAILAARRSRPRRGILIYSAALCVLALAAIRMAPAVAPIGLPQQGLIAALEARHLRDGYAPYWLASALTLESDGALRVRAVNSAKTGRLRPKKWFAKADWYEGAPEDAAFFVLTSPLEKTLWPAAVLARFGPPVAQFGFGVVTAYVYDGGLPALR